LAVAQEANRDDTKPKVVNAVTLEVTPEEAEKIDLARSIGTLSLVLRNPVDRSETETLGVHREDLLAAVSATADQPAVNKPEPVPAAAPAVARRATKPVAAPVARVPAEPARAAAVEVIRGVQKADVEF
jgi:pilus assembly protein CpaB